VAEVVELLLSKSEVLSSKSNILQKAKKKNQPNKPKNKNTCIFFFKGQGMCLADFHLKLS
jgi:hypothetical protein